MFFQKEIGNKVFQLQPGKQDMDREGKGKIEEERGKQHNQLFRKLSDCGN